MTATKRKEMQWPRRDSCTHAKNEASNLKRCIGRHFPSLSLLDVMYIKTYCAEQTGKAARDERRDTIICKTLLGVAITAPAYGIGNSYEIF